MKKIFTFLAISFLLITSCENTYTAYHKAKSENTITAYENFINEYPKSKYVDSANAEITFLTTGEYPFELVVATTEVSDTTLTEDEEISWIAAKELDDKDGYDSFISMYNDGYYSDSANVILYFMNKSMVLSFEDNTNGIVETLNLEFVEDEITGTSEGSLVSDDETIRWTAEISGIREGMWLVVEYKLLTYTNMEDLEETSKVRYYQLAEGGIYYGEEFYEVTTEEEISK